MKLKKEMSVLFVLLALLLVSVITAFVAGLVVFEPDTGVGDTGIAPDERAMVHIDLLTEKRDVPDEGLDDLGIPSSVRKYDLMVFDTPAIRDQLLRGELLTVYLAGQPYVADLQESLLDAEVRSAGICSFTGTLAGGGDVVLTLNDDVLVGRFVTGATEYSVESTRLNDTIYPEKVLHYAYSSADVVAEGPPAMLSGYYTTILNISRGDGEEYGIPANGTEVEFMNVGYEVVRLTDADLKDFPTVNETIQTDIQELSIPVDEVERIVEKNYRGKIAEYHGSYYLIDFCKS
ncbi:hypothetical protein [Methanogenium organophilum]|uniref:Uncharacterized protein n=1 Tax=Methanogenium organophilum TaxID=2199 RepID=A0A9X9S4S0_METOG|nr:hypothetical protein [Methanogenium organophilum]WAI01455.1 hypothetical protein OU421_00870 [Methanogenium organophilum]